MTPIDPITVVATGIEVLLSNEKIRATLLNGIDTAAQHFNKFLLKFFTPEQAKAAKQLAVATAMPGVNAAAIQAGPNSNIPTDEPTVAAAVEALYQASKTAATPEPSTPSSPVEDLEVLGLNLAIAILQRRTVKQ